MTTVEYLSQQILKEKRYVNESKGLVTVLKAYERNLVVIVSIRDSINQMKNQIRSLEDVQYQKTLSQQQKKLFYYAKDLSDLIDDCYFCYLAQLYKLIDIEFVQKNHYVSLFEDTKRKVFQITKDLWKLMNGVNNSIMFINRYRKSYRNMKEIFESHDFKEDINKSQFYSQTLKEKEHDSQIMGSLRKSLIMSNKRLQETERRFVGLLLKLEHIFDEE